MSNPQRPELHNPSIRKAGLFASLLYFGISSAVFFTALYVILPLLAGKFSWFQIFNIVLVIPMAVLLAAALVAVKIENNGYTPGDIKQRFRLQSMGWYEWLWTVSLSVFMFGGSLALPVAGGLAVLAIFVRGKVDGSFSFVKVIGIAVFLAASWGIWQLNSFLSDIQLYESPQHVEAFFSQFGNDAFMGIVLKDQWWIVVYYLVVLLVLNIGGEELWWRGYLLPKQELAFGKFTWLIHGVLWSAFHLFFQWTLYDLIRMLPTCCALSYVAQHTRNTWPAIIGHTVGNSGILIQIIRGVAGLG